MAYITTDDVRRIRVALKEAFPEFKISVRKGSSGSSVNVTFLKGPIDFSVYPNINQYGYMDINQYHLHQYPDHQEFFAAVVRLIKEVPSRKWYDRSDAMVDYFNTAFYFHVSVGAWDRPYEYKASKKFSMDNLTNTVDVVLAARELAG